MARTGSRRWTRAPTGERGRGRRTWARIDALEGADGRVEVTVADDGSDIPEIERAVASGETAIDQLDHSQGIGRWFVKRVADLSGGSVAFDDAEGAAVTVRLGRAPA